MDDQSIDNNIEKEWNLNFHGNSYMIDILSQGNTLSISVESNDTNQRWTSEFTSQYIEEITLKAGSFKKYSVFVKMLISAFNKESDSVFVDLLTASDLEALKARKMGNSMSDNKSISTSQASSNIKKRYIILTYSGEFDRVHYPLPLPFEETPNPSALRRTISRLRRQLEQLKKGEVVTADTSTDKEARIMVTQLRQENTELRHRLRQLQGKGNIQKDNVTSDLTIANSKLRKQVEILKKDLNEAGIAYEKLRTDTAREIGRWKAKLGSDKDKDSSSDPLDFYTTKQQGTAEFLLRKRVSDLEKELQYYRKSTSMKDAARSTLGVRASTVNAYNAYNGTRSSSAPLRQRSASPVTSTNNNKVTQNKNRPSTAGSRTSLTSSNSSNVKNSTQNQTRGRSASPSHQLASSSLGKRFDPTAYQQSRAEKFPSKKNVWGSVESNTRSGSSSRYVKRESGYSSANSDGSRGSRASRGSDGIYSRRLSGNMSDTSQGNEKGRKEKKKSSKKSYTKQTGSDSEDDVIARNLKAKYNPVKVVDMNTSSRTEQVVINTSKPLTSPTRPLTNFTGSGKGIAEDGVKISNKQLTIDADNDDDDSISGDENEKLDLNRQVLSPKDRMKPEQIRESRRNGITNDSTAGIAASNIALSQSYDSTDKIRASNESFAKSPSRNEGSLKDVKSPSRLQRLSKEVPKSPLPKKGPEQDISEIDRRIQALQNYLDNARMGILSNDDN